MTAFLSATAVAQESAPQGTAANPEGSQAPVLSSTEDGRTTVLDSFKSRRDKIAEERRQSIEESTISWQARTYDFDRVNSNDSRSAAWALGGSLGVETGFFRHLVSFGATAYTSQPLYAPSDESGSKLLTNDQSGYTVLGEAYAQFKLSDDLGLTAGRRAFDTPYLARHDTRMTPQTFEGVVLQGTNSGDDDDTGEWRYGAGYVDKEKEVNSGDFIDLARVAGAKVDRGVALGGVNYRQKDWGLGAVEYYSPDIINIFYTEAHYSIHAGETRDVNLHAQYTNQHSVGQELLTGSAFSANQLGVKAELATGGTLWTAAYTETGRGSTMQSPWSGYPGYTSVQYNDFFNAGENAFMLRAACTLKYLPGISAYGLWVRGTGSDKPSTQNEYDASLEWSPPQGMLRGMMLRARFAYFTETAKGPVTELRLMLFYTPPAK